MRKLLCLLVLILITSLVFSSGCARGVTKEPAAEGTPSITPMQNATDQVGSVTQEALDLLKEDLESLEFDEPGGLAGD
jgi:hypothetical protein